MIRQLISAELITNHIYYRKGEKKMKNKLFILITLGLLTGFLIACSMLGSKSGEAKCTGTATIDHITPGETKMLNGVSHTLGEETVMSHESNCPEMIGVMTVNSNFIGSGYNIWGTFYFETAYDGGGTFEGTQYAVNKPDGTFEGVATSYEATGSLSGLQLEYILRARNDFYTTSGQFEATIRNLPEE